MDLRPHHLLCIQKYTGHGYSPDFTAHMNSVVSELKKNPDTSITLTCGCDELCRRCPNNAGGVCSSSEKTAMFDAAVLGICSFSCGEKLSWSDASEKARRLIIKTEKFSKVCSSCQWFELCKSTEVYCD
ncbi:MAG: DUF1284 domain-containing protein [Eubacteriales bacterium]